jgi:hypothetical protein
MLFEWRRKDEITFLLHSYGMRHSNNDIDRDTKMVEYCMKHNDYRILQRNRHIDIHFVTSYCNLL